VCERAVEGGKRRGGEKGKREKRAGLGEDIPTPMRVRGLCERGRQKEGGEEGEEKGKAREESWIRRGYTHSNEGSQGHVPPTSGVSIKTG
jgi:hypothetical protein